MSSSGIEIYADAEEEYHITHGPSQEMETIKNNIAQSLISTRNTVNVDDKSLWLRFFF